MTVVLGVSLLSATAAANASFAQTAPQTAPRAVLAQSGATSDCLTYANTFDNGANISPAEAIKAFTAPPAPVDAWFNSTDVDERGIWNPNDQRPWKFAQEFARLLCYTSDNADITAAYYFFRATNASNEEEVNRPESDSETVYKALEWLTKNRNVKVNFLLDNTNTCTTSAPTQSCTNIMTRTARGAVEKRMAKFKPGSANIYYCINGCFNTARYGVYPYAIEHEKFWTVSDTDFPGETAGTNPLVISTSANLARSQIRNYRQEASSIYDDMIAYDQFKLRFDGMKSCAIETCALLGDRKVLNTDNPDLATTTPNPLAVVQEGDRRIWVDPILRRTTDNGRGTSITFSPGRAADADSFDVYINQFDNVECDTDGKIRLAMFKLTDAKATRMASVLKSLKTRGCDVKMLMTAQAGQTVISSSVRSTLDSAKVDYKCAVDGMHTKLILIGPRTGNLGSILTGTQNMSVAGQLYNEEHVVTFDAQKAVGATRNAIRAVYDVYQREWTELAQGASKGNCTP
ncbi:MAG: phospholipase D-like domain-containing protein [Aeromicrobium sp.]